MSFNQAVYQSLINVSHFIETEQTIDSKVIWSENFTRPSFFIDEYKFNQSLISFPQIDLL